MIEYIIFIFALSLVFYAVLAGADFGAGMIECFSRARNRRQDEELISHALAPVWEANHVWIILSVVILFSAFPFVFAEVVTYFHIPLLLMLFGITLRGCAFTFRHYDPFYDASHRLYTQTFIASSFLTPLAQGLIVGGCMLGRVPVDRASFAEVYIFPWLNLFSLSVGVFLSCLYFFLASVFLLGETSEAAAQQRLLRRVHSGIVALCTSSLLVFFSAEYVGFKLFRLYTESTWAILGMCLAGCTLAALASLLRQKRFQMARFAAAFFVTLVLCSWFAITFPFVLGGHPDATHSLNLLENLAPAATLRQLCIALTIGALCIFPSLGYLLHVFKNPHRL